MAIPIKSLRMRARLTHPFRLGLKNGGPTRHWKILNALLLLEERKGSGTTLEIAFESGLEINDATKLLEQLKGTSVIHLDGKNWVARWKLVQLKPKGYNEVYRAYLREPDPIRVTIKNPRKKKG